MNIHSDIASSHSGLEALMSKHLTHIHLHMFLWHLLFSAMVSQYKANDPQIALHSLFCFKMTSIAQLTTTHTCIRRPWLSLRQSYGYIYCIV